VQFFEFRSESAWWYVFGIAFVTAILVETLHPFRKLSTSTTRRWISNGVLLAASTLVTRCAFQLSGIALAMGARANRDGLLNRVALPLGARFFLGICALDLTHYFTHRLLHAFGMLWRVHRVHHSENDLDATTGLRFHPAEGLITQGAPLLTIALLGVPASAVVVEALMVVVQDLFTHANVGLPAWLERYLRFVIITPGMHRTHHSEEFDEQNTNFGTIFSLWDRLFATYQAEPAAGGQIRCGVTELPEGSSLHAGALLLLPFRDAPGVAQADAVQHAPLTD